VKKGPLAEAQVVQCLQEHGWPYAERRVMGGRHDRGDVSGIAGVVIEVKDHAKMQLAEWIGEAEREAMNGHAVGELMDLGIVVHKRRGKGNPLDWYASMSVRTLLALLTAYTKED